MRRSISGLVAAALYVALMTFVTLPAIAQGTEGIGQVTVSGNQLTRDRNPWIPHGFFQIAFAVPPKAQKIPNANPNFAAAYENYSPTEYADMRNAGADSVRMNIAQDGSDPENEKYFDLQWLEQVIGAVRAARAAGLTVIMSIQDETQTGDSTKAPLPDDATRRVWREFAPIFGQDRGVLFELYNEPNLHPKASADQAPSREDWKQWASAMNETLTLVRALGAVNVVVADGLVSAQQLSGAPKLNDPLNQIAYASHPYPSGKTQAAAAYNQTKAAWAEKFGDFSKTEPVIITEWGVGYYCDENTPASVMKFLGYLQEHNVGLEAVAWDWQEYDFASAVQNFPNPNFSSLLTLATPTACSAANGYTPGKGTGPDTSYGPGRMIRTWYLTGVPPATPQ
jgi:endoglucanase